MPPEGRQWLGAWAARWLGETYPRDDRGSDVAAYFAAVGTDPLDEAITTLCEAYLEAGPEARADIRALFEDRRGFRQNLLAYVFRMASALHRDPSRRWVRSAIAAAAIEDGRLDYRDSIVALIVLRWAAERSGLEVRGEFEALSGLAGERTGSILRGLPARSASEVEYTVKRMTAAAWRRAFGAS